MMMVVVTAKTSDLFHTTRDHRHHCRMTIAISLLSRNRKILIIRIVVTFEIIKMHTTIKLPLISLPLGGEAGHSDGVTKEEGG